MATQQFWTTVKIFFGVACVIVALIWFIRMRNWQGRNVRMSAVLNNPNPNVIDYKYTVRQMTQEIGRRRVLMITCYLLTFI